MKSPNPAFLISPSSGRYHTSHHAKAILASNPPLRPVRQTKAAFGRNIGKYGRRLVYGRSNFAAFLSQSQPRQGCRFGFCWYTINRGLYSGVFVANREKKMIGSSNFEFGYYLAALISSWFIIAIYFILIRPSYGKH